MKLLTKQATASILADIEALLVGVTAGGRDVSTLLPALPTSIDGIQVSLLVDAMKAAEADVSIMILEFAKHDFLDLAETGFIDVLSIAGMFGVPGTNITATIAPYIFDWLNSLLAKNGVVSGSMFFGSLTVAHSNFGSIIAAAETGEVVEAGLMTVEDLLTVAGLIVPGPEVTIARIVTEVAMYVVVNGKPIDIRALLSTSGLDEPLELLEGKTIRNPAYPSYKWDMFRGWIYSPIPGSE